VALETRTGPSAEDASLGLLHPANGSRVGSTPGAGFDADVFSILIRGVEWGMLPSSSSPTECANFPFPFFMEEVFSQRCDDTPTALPSAGSPDRRDSHFCQLVAT
jgi:hypothetical protein